MRPTGGASGRRLAVAAVVAAIGLASSLAWPRGETRPDPRPNVIVVLTDDQAWDTLDAMPWLRGQLSRAGSGWTSFPLAFSNTPICCPARASLLTGRYARQTGVLRNEDGAALDASETLATWLRAAGYRTALVGKYLNRYPFGGPPTVPPGWDRFVAKLNRSQATVYRDFDVVNQGSPVHVGDAYATDWLADRAADFIRTASPERPFFLLFTPSAPHPPWEPADRHLGRYAGLPLPEPPSVAGALRGAPPWVRTLPQPDAAQRAAWLDERRRAMETLVAVDDAIRGIVDALGTRLENTYIFVSSDNGYSFGEHRWHGKKCPYEACARIPLAVHSPAGPVDTRGTIVSLVDVAPTILSLARVSQPPSVDGVGFADRFAPWGPLTRPTGAVFLEWAGDDEVPAWEAVRTRDLKLIRYADGIEELYDLTGRYGSADPFETENRIRDPAYAEVLEDLRSLLGRHPGRR